MVSSTITSINTSLTDLDMLIRIYAVSSVYNIPSLLKLRLGNLKTFLVWATKLGNDAHPSNPRLLKFGRLANLKAFLFCAIKLCLCNDGSLLEGIEDVVGRITLEIKYERDAAAFINWAIKIIHEIEHLEEAIDEWYIAVSDCAQEFIRSLTADDVVEITDSILENIETFVRLRYHTEFAVEPMDALRVQMTFLKSLLCFAMETSVEHRRLEDLLIHFARVAVSAAGLFIHGHLQCLNENWCEEDQLKFSILIEKIKPIDPQVYQTYTQALCSSKLSRSLHAPALDMDDDTMNVLKNFLDSLIDVLWDLLQLHSYCLVSDKDLQALHEGLRFFRTILKQQSKNSDEKIRDQIGVLVCEAGDLICSFYQTHAKIDLGLIDLLERIKVIRAEVEEKVLQTSIFNSPRTDELGFLDSVLGNLMELTSYTSEPIAKNLIQTIQEELVYLRSFLGETVELHNEQVELQTLWNRILEASYRVDFLIDHFVLEDTSYSFLDLFDSIMEDIRDIKIDMSKISYGNRQGMKIKKVAPILNHVRPQSTFLTNEVVGFHDEAASILDRLKGGSKQLRIVAISGMPGLGKTTLASKVYNAPSVMCHFGVRAWCAISQVLDKKKVLLELLNQIDSSKYSEMAEEDLANMLRRRLKEKRYLIFLDDVWSIEAWHSLGGSFPDDSTGSRIILTSRLQNVAPRAILDQEPHSLRPLDQYESLELLQRKLFPGKGWPPTLYDLGMQIAENCRGLPLTIVIIAGILATTVQQGWKEIVDSLSSGTLSTIEQSRNTLELSYKHLPDYLKPCFLYFGAFPEDQKISVKRLIQLWIAEGFVRKTDSKRLEDVAEDYIMDLIERSLIMVAKQRSIGGAKTCRIHDLLHDFCVTKAKEENFFHLLQGNDQLSDFNEPFYLRRLCIYSDLVILKKPKLFCPRVRSLLFSSPRNLPPNTADLDYFNISFIIQIFKLLKVLDLERSILVKGLPSEIDLLVQLKYLSIRGSINVIPSSIGKLLNLETFIVDTFADTTSLPHTLWNLQKLKYLHVQGVGTHDIGILPTENLENSSILHELESFSGTIDSNASIEKQMSKFPNIRRLKCKLAPVGETVDFVYGIIVLDFLSQLESLYMSAFDRRHCITDLALPANLKKLTLAALRLPWRKISTIGKLPNLEVLKLLYESFLGETWDVEDGDFSKLRFLKLSDLEIVKWTASDDQFPSLQKLVLNECKYLEEIPSCLESIPTLEEIEVSYCSGTVTGLVEKIKETQVDLGNLSMKISIQSSY